jgi:hypothetical protein
MEIGLKSIIRALFLKRYAYCINTYKNILNIKNYYHEHINNNRNNHLCYTPCINYCYFNNQRQKTV